MTSITDWIAVNLADDLGEKTGRKSAYLREVMRQYTDPTIERITYHQPRVAGYASYRPLQLVLIDDEPTLDPDVKVQLEQAWDRWPSTCTSEVDASAQIDDLELQIEKVRAEKLDRMQRAQHVMLFKVLYDLERERLLRSMIAGFRAAVTEDERPKPSTPRERLRAMKAHPRSARGRR